MDKKFIIFIILSVAILYFSTNFTMQKARERQIKTPPIQSQTIESEHKKPEKSINNTASSITSNEKEKIYEYENNVTELNAINLGGSIQSLTIKAKLAGKEGKIDFITPNEGNDNFKFSCKYNNEDLFLNRRAWEITSTEKELAFLCDISEKIEVKKKITFNEDHSSKIEIIIKNLNQQPSKISEPRLLWRISKDTRNQANLKEIVVYTKNKIYRFKPKKKQEIQRIQEKPEWTGLKDQYFCSVFYGSDPKMEAIEIQYNDDQSMLLNQIFPEIMLNPLEEKSIMLQAYFGPQNYVELKKHGYQIFKIVHFGFFHVIGVPLYYTLRFFYSLTRNYGLAIILLTILIRIILWWPTQKSYSSMKKMQTAMNKMQPRLKTLKEIYKNDPNKLNEETMKLYREYQINPMSGCLPMLLQMPIFFALYSTLVSAVELKGAEFVWFWKDLSLKDPYYVLPLLMGITMFIQQKISTPPAATPEAAAQQKMMLYFMPAMLTFFAFVWPSGLLLYWVVSNILSIGQQIIINQSR